MAIIHQTTMTPGKLDLLAAWLPAQPWYRATGREPELARAGGFRLDDPDGEVGIEFMVVTDGSGSEVTAYQVPLTYRAGPLDGADGALIGTSEHGVLGCRWIYDGMQDPVLVERLVALVQGQAEPQAQSVSDTADPTVTSHPVTGESLTPVRSAVTSGPSGTDLRVATAVDGGAPAGELILRVSRVLQAGDRPDASPSPDASPDAGAPCVSATWRLPDGSSARGVFATGRYARP